MLNPLDDWTSGYTQPGPLKNALGSAPTGAQPHGGNSLEQAWAPMGGASGGTITPGPSAPRPAAAPGQANPADSITRSLGVAPAANWSLTDTPAPTGPTARATPDYSTHVAAVTAGDPNAPDALARKLASDFTTAGHKVTWGANGELQVDGRPYDVLGSTGYQAMTADPNAGAPPPFPGHGAPPPPTPPTTPTPAPDPGQTTAPTTAPTDQTTTAPTFNEAELQRLWMQESTQMPSNWTWTQRVMEFLANHPQISSGVNLAGSNSTKFKTPDGRIIDLVFSSNDPAHARPQWLDVTNGGGAPAPTSGAVSPGLAGLWDQAGRLTDQTPYQPTTNPQLDAFITQLLGHPESMDPHTVETMKAADAEEQQQAADSADTSLKRFGFGSGLGDSNWLASERAATARSADQGIIAGRRNIDIKAAETNMADRRAAAGIGINKLQLDNQIKAQAAQLGLTREQLISAILQHISSLEQNDRQFGADLGYRYDQLNSSNNNAYWNGTQ